MIIPIFCISIKVNDFQIYMIFLSVMKFILLVTNNDDANDAY